VSRQTEGAWRWVGYSIYVWDVSPDLRVVVSEPHHGTKGLYWEIRHLDGEVVSSSHKCYQNRDAAIKAAERGWQTFFDGMFHETHRMPKQ